MQEKVLLQVKPGATKAKGKIQKGSRVERGRSKAREISPMGNDGTRRQWDGTEDLGRPGRQGRQEQAGRQVQSGKQGRRDSKAQQGRQGNWGRHETKKRLVIVCSMATILCNIR